MNAKLHRTAAYGALHNTADTLNALLSNALSNTHPLELSGETIIDIRAAVSWIHAAQREMESESQS